MLNDLLRWNFWRVVDKTVDRVASEPSNFKFYSQVSSWFSYMKLLRLKYVHFKSKFEWCSTRIILGTKSSFCAPQVAQSITQPTTRHLFHSVVFRSHPSEWLIVWPFPIINPCIFILFGKRSLIILRKNGKNLNNKRIRVVFEIDTLNSFFHSCRVRSEVTESILIFSFSRGTVINCLPCPAQRRGWESV